MRRILLQFIGPVLGIMLCSGVVSAHAAVKHAPENEYLDLDITQLMQITITSVSKKPQVLADTPTAVFVITADDIHRSGITSLPEALRMVPGLQVSRVGAEKWAVTARGFNGQTANKLLVLMDGRTLYSPAFSGVYWNEQDTMLEDIDRIEVIRGPGGTIWGANAVNGIINIITKNAAETKGGVIRVATGNKERLYNGMRYGTDLSSSVQGRVYLTWRDHDSLNLHDSGDDADDSWETVRGGFRMDGEVATSTWTFQGDAYVVDANQLLVPYYEPDPPYISAVRDSYKASGWNLLARWRHRFSKDNSWNIQTYYDFTSRDELILGDTHNTFDIEFQHNVRLGNRHDLIWGLGYRNIHDKFDNSFQLSFSPASDTQELFNGFVQDEIVLQPDRLWFTLGTKIEHNDYTGYEIQPSGRLLYKPVENQSLWAAISRAVRTPSRIERDGRITAMVVPDFSPHPTVFYMQGSDDFDSEEVLAYECGYRWLPAREFSFDVALFYNDYDMLRTSTPMTMATTEIRFENKSRGSSYGIELEADWQPRPWLLLQLGYSYLQLDLDVDGDDVGLDFIAVYDDSSPHHQVSLRSSIDLGHNWQTNFWLRYTDSFASAGREVSLPQQNIDNYLAFDINVFWRPDSHLEFMLAGRNIFTSDRLEFFSEYLAPKTDIARSVLGKISYNF